MTIYTDSIGNKFVGYNGEYTETLSGFDLMNSTSSSSIDKLIESFSGVITEKAVSSNLGNNNNLYGIVWNVDGVQPNGTVNDNGVADLGDGDYGLTFLVSTGGNLIAISASVLSQNNIYSNVSFENSFYDGFMANATFAVAQMSSKNDFGIFGWNDENNYEFLWVGETKGNPNISVPQNRATIYVGVNGGTLVDRVSFGVKQADSTTKRIQLDTEAGANHAINCGTGTAKLFLIEDDGSGGVAGDVGYCPNLYLSQDTSLVVGQFVSLSGLTDGGSTHGVVVSDWGDAGKIIMRMYDGVN